MAVTVNVNGTAYPIPTAGDVDWGQRFVNWATAISGHTSAEGLVFINVKSAPYNAVGNGVADDTAAIQAAFNALSGNPITGADPVTGVLYFPKGIYCVSSSLTYYGAPGYGIVWFGDIGSMRGANQGSTLKWIGASGGTMVRLYGINGSIIESMAFNGDNVAKYVIHSTEWNGGGLGSYVGLVGSSGLKMRDCFMQRWAGAASAGFAAGQASPGNLQADTYMFENTSFQGNEVDSDAGFRSLTSGNTKNWAFTDCNVTGLNYGIDCANFSGTMRIVSSDFGNIGLNVDGAAIRVGSGNGCVILDCAMENRGVGRRAKFLDNSGNGTSIAIIGSYFEGNCPSDDIAVKSAGRLFIQGCGFINHRTAGVDAIIQMSQGCLLESAAGVAQNTYDSLELNGCTFYRTGTAPAVPNIIDGNGNSMTSGEYPRTVRTSLRVIGCRGGVLGGSGNYPMPDLIGSPPCILPQTFFENQNSTGVTVLANEADTYRVRVPYTAFQGAFTTKQLTVGRPRKGTRVKSVVADTTTAFGGDGGSPVTGTLQLSVDSSATVAGYIAAHDVKTAAVTKGLADADLGTELVRSAAVAGGHVQSWTADGYVKVTLTCSVENLSALRQGSVTLYIKHENMR